MPQQTLLRLALLLVPATSLTPQPLPLLLPNAAEAALPPSPAPFGHPDDYGLEGLIAGAVLLGGAITFLAVADCGLADECDPGDVVLVSLGGIVLGGLTSFRERRGDAGRLEGVLVVRNAARCSMAESLRIIGVPGAPRQAQLGRSVTPLRAQ